MNHVQMRARYRFDMIQKEKEKLFDSLNNNFHQINESNFRQLKFEK